MEMPDIDVEALVNRENPLPSDYIPSDLYITDNNENNFHNYKDPSLKPMMRLIVKPYIDQMFLDARDFDIRNFYS